MIMISKHNLTTILYVCKTMCTVIEVNYAL